MGPELIELRQYTLHPGRRDVLVELFERELVEPQEAVGLQVVGTFLDLDDPDRFVWLRSFADGAPRAASLAAFYDGPVWQRHRNEANATMVDSDNVLLLRPARPSSGFALDLPARAPAGAVERPPGVVTATLCPLAAPATEELVALFERSIEPLWTGAGAELIACLVTDPMPNDFPRLPVREGEPMFVWFSRFASLSAQRDHAAALPASPPWRDTAWPAWRKRLTADPQRLRLVPTARSSLHA